jgi:hypothetical protein
VLLVSSSSSSSNSSRVCCSPQCDVHVALYIEQLVGCALSETQAVSWSYHNVHQTAVLAAVCRALCTVHVACMLSTASMHHHQHICLVLVASVITATTCSLQLLLAYSPITCTTATKCRSKHRCLLCVDVVYIWQEVARHAWRVTHHILAYVPHRCCPSQTQPDRKQAAVCAVQSSLCPGP